MFDAIRFDSQSRLSVVGMLVTGVSAISLLLTGYGYRPSAWLLLLFSAAFAVSTLTRFLKPRQRDVQIAITLALSSPRIAALLDEHLERASFDADVANGKSHGSRRQRWRLEYALRSALISIRNHGLVMPVTTIRLSSSVEKALPQANESQNKVLSRLVSVS